MPSWTVTLRPPGAASTTNLVMSEIAAKTESEAYANASAIAFRQGIGVGFNYISAKKKEVSPCELPPAAALAFYSEDRTFYWVTSRCGWTMQKHEATIHHTVEGLDISKKLVATLFPNVKFRVVPA